MPKTNHPIEQEELMAYLDGELPVDRAGFAAGHLEHCRECQGIAADLQGVSRRLMDWQVEPVSEEIGPVLAAALKESGRPKSARKISRWVWALASAGVAAVLVLMVPSLQLASLRQRQMLSVQMDQRSSACKCTGKTSAPSVAGNAMAGFP